MPPRVPSSEKYVWTMTAEPPACGRSGPSIRVLQTCPRLRKDQHCYCRFDTGAIAADLEEAGAAAVAEWFLTPLEADDIPDLITDFERAVNRTSADEEATGRLRLVLADLKRLEEAGSGLTDEYSDDLD